MTQAVTTTGGNALASAADFNPFLQEALNSGLKFGQFLNFNGNEGHFTYGAKESKVELPHGTCLAMNLNEYRRGWYCWKNKDVADKVLVGILQGSPPAEAALPDHGPYETYKDGSQDGWTRAGEITCVDVNDGLGVFDFSFYNVSSMMAFEALLGAFGKVYKMHAGEVPVVEIGSRSFVPKGVRGEAKKWAPTYKIVGWISTDEYDALSAEATSGSTGSTEKGSDNAANYASTANEGVKTVTTGNTTTVTKSQDHPPESAAQPSEADILRAKLAELEAASAAAKAAQVETKVDVPFEGSTKVAETVAGPAGAAPESRRSRRFGGAG